MNEINTNLEYKEHLKRHGFILKEKIGDGLSGGTYKGVQKTLNRSVAIKFFDNIYSMKDSNLRKRFLREPNLLSELEHPSIPYVITKGEVNSGGNDVPYIVMQYISGQNLDKYLKTNGKMDLESVLHIAFQLLDALNFVHEKGIVHRDVKPANIMLLPSGNCYLIDFSIGFKKNVGPGMTRATMTGDHLGSVPYMSPEQLSNMKEVDGRSDLYSLTKVICELITGSPEIIGLREISPEINSEMIRVLKKGLEHKAQNRYASAKDYLRELKRSSIISSSFTATPSPAICLNKTCPKANWSPQGYYKGPNFIEECTNTFCINCGGELMYKCQGCDQPIEYTHYCGGCGTEQFQIPECKKCGSFLQKNDMSQDTELLGCSKCIRKAEQSKNSPKFDDFDDDIPF